MPETEAARPTLVADTQDALDPADTARSLHTKVGELFESARNDVYYYVLTLGPPPAQAQEITQEAFLRLYASLKTGDPIENMRAWVFRVAHNLALKSRTRESKLHPLETELESQLRGRYQDIESELIHRDRQERFAEAVAGLSPQQRQVLHLRAEGLRYREIAEVLGLGTSTVNEFLRRAISKLKKVLHE
jgi:RNA polymerase sigma-70 factor (ECF subfamily)